MKRQYAGTGSSDAVRDLFVREYVEPARVSHTKIIVSQSELKAKMVKLGFPVGNANQIGTSIEAGYFLTQYGLRLCSPKGQSRRNETLYEFEFVDQPVSEMVFPETPSQRAFRVTEGIRGLLKDEIASFGGTEAFMRWVRSEDEEAA